MNLVAHKVGPAIAIRCVNDSRFELQAGICTENVRTAFDAAEKLHVGGVMIYDIPIFRIDHMPYGGGKEFSHAQAGGANACPTY